MEPRKGYQTETDIILKGYLVMVESKLGKPGLQLRSWAHTGSLSVSASYEAPLQTLLTVPTDWQKTMIPNMSLNQMQVTPHIHALRIPFQVPISPTRKNNILRAYNCAATNHLSFI